uniref:Uncharacterized protein n=1 Tax=Tetranychus urticae TaxID=32264 RepID=T1JST9_TETUR
MLPAAKNGKINVHHFLYSFHSHHPIIFKFHSTIGFSDVSKLIDI